MNIFNKIIKTSIYLLVFLVPIFFLPFSFEAYEFNKQYLLFFLVSLAFFAWLAKMILVDKEIRFRRTPLDIPVLIFLLVAILSAIFSVDKSSSIFGFYGRFSNGLVGFLGLGVLYFLLTNNVKDVKGELKDVKGVLRVFLISVFFVILISYLSIFGIWQKLSSNLPPLMLQKTFNPVSGSLEGLAIFLAVVVVLLVGMILVRDDKGEKGILRGVKGLVLYLLSIFALGLLVLIDFSLAWLVILFSLGIFLIFSLTTRIFREDVNRLLLVMVLLAISAFFLVINTSSFGKLDIFNFPRELVLNQEMSWKVALGSATDDIRAVFLGSGIGTYHYDFAKFKPYDFNQSPLWQIRYDRAGNYLSELLATLGFLGLLSYLILIGLFLLVSWFLLGDVKGELRDVKGVQLPLLMTFFALLISQFVYYQNTVLAFTFWFILGLAAISWQKSIPEKTISLKNFPEINLVFSSLLVFFCLVVLLSYYFGFRFYLADINYLKAQLIPPGEERIKILEKAVSLNPGLSVYQIVLARTYLSQISAETGKPLAEQDAAKIQNLVAKAIDKAKRASELSPNNVAGWETLGMIYREIRPLAGGASDWAVKSFQKAIELEPKNPVLYTELGKLYSVSEPQKARENFARAKKLKSDYLDSQIQDALTYEAEQNLDEAIKRLEEVVKNYPLIIESKFQLGRLYFNSNRIDDAISQFEDVLFLFPQHSNSLYSLGLAYAKKGEKEKAISYFERVLQLNPANQEVINKIQELKK